MKKQSLLWLAVTTTLLSGCTGTNKQLPSDMQMPPPKHRPQLTLTVDTVRTDTTADNPVCLEPKKYGSRLYERHPGLFAGTKDVVLRSTFFDDSLTLSPETLRRMIKYSVCVESLATSAGTGTFTDDIPSGVRIQIVPDIQEAPGNISLQLSATDRKQKHTIEQNISLRPEQSLVVSGFTTNDADENRIILITPHLR
ncbi:TPA: hypothetical protein O7V46_002798 [Escherichia coli]|nr:hypothetical protein [Escherichia coli]EFB8548751.1 hypothetical protein [Escherichia coli]EFF3148989.1 hypothetical protein [Escherichia coli]EFJ6973023.1 hypothetical protein [Escherichia coli]EFV3177463.1 hypothetical protein [Escherichia coli]